jgi:hypothetical protein
MSTASWGSDAIAAAAAVNASGRPCRRLSVDMTRRRRRLSFLGPVEPQPRADVTVASIHHDQHAVGAVRVDGHADGTPLHWCSLMWVVSRRPAY